MSVDVAEPGRASEGARRIAWTERAMPVLARIAERFAADRPLDGLRVAACLHVTTETAVLVRTLLAGGAQVALAASNPLATQDDVAAALASDGARVFARHGADRATYARHVHAALDGGAHLLLDDGCDLVTTLHAVRPELLGQVRGACEETRTGIVRLRQMAGDGALRVPVLAVSDTGTTRLVADRYGTGQSVLDAVVRATHTLLAGRTVVVAGFGPAGRGVAQRAAGAGARVVVTEVDAVPALEATLAGYQVLPMGEAARLADVLVTATGNTGVVGAEHLDLLPDGAVLVNAGHFDVEIDLRALSAAAVEVEHGVRPYADAYVMPDGRRLVLLAGGQVANLAVAEGSPPAVMDVAFAVQAVATAWLAAHGERLGPGVHAVPPELDREVAALALDVRGVRLDRLTPDQVRYRTAWQRPG